MATRSHVLFSLAFSGLLAHELDAIDKHEWRLLFVLRGMSDAPARRAFILLHVPLVALLLWLISHPNQRVRTWAVRALDGFMILHAILHWRLSNHPKYEFRPWYSRLLIDGTAATGLAHLVLEWRAGAQAER
jgi:hypothetical protein